MDMLMTPDAIQATRQALGMTLKEFGELLKVSEATASRWESGHQRPRYDMLVRLNRIAEDSGIKEPSPKAAAAG